MFLAVVVSLPAQMALSIGPLRPGVPPRRRCQRHGSVSLATAHVMQSNPRPDSAKSTAASAPPQPPQGSRSSTDPAPSAPSGKAEADELSSAVRIASFRHSTTFSASLILPVSAQTLDYTPDSHDTTLPAPTVITAVYAPGSAVAPTRPPTTPAAVDDSPKVDSCVSSVVPEWQRAQLEQFLGRLPREAATQWLGERLYTYISNNHSALYAPKVTGMLIEFDHADILDLLFDKAALDGRVLEGIDVIQATT